MQIGMPALCILKAAAEEGSKPSHTELLSADGTAIRVP
jgi:hypothetical protein